MEAKVKSWTVIRDDGTYLQAKTGTLRLYRTRGEASEAAAKAKGKNKVQRVEITPV